MRYTARIGERDIIISLERLGPGRHAARVEGSEEVVEARRVEGSILLAGKGGRTIEAVVMRETGAGPAVMAGGAGRGERSYAVLIGPRLYPVRLLDPLRVGSTAAVLRREGPAEVRSIMPGKVAALLVQKGQAVKAGQGVVVVEAMKMENELPAPKDGRVTSVRVRPGETVEAGALLLVVE